MDPQLIVNGIALGSIIALGAVGLTLTYGILRLSNFAHGDYMTVGAFVAWMLNMSPIPVLNNIWVSMVDRNYRHCRGSIASGSRAYGNECVASEQQQRHW